MRALIIFTVTYLLIAPAQAQYSGGNGTAGDPYQIATAEDLIALGEEPNDYDKHFIMTADIDLDPNLPGRRVFDRAVIAPDVNDDEWVFQGTAFTGVFDGGGHIIRNAVVNMPENNHIGLFGLLGGQVENLGVENASIVGSNYVGGLVGHHCGIISNCYATGSVSGDRKVGGLVGENGRWGLMGSCRITGSYSSCTVSGEAAVGGLVGRNEKSSITASSSSGTTSGGFAVGGIAGVNVASSITASSSSGTTSGVNEVGGLVGWNEGSSITASSSSGTTSGANVVGGLVGKNEAGVITASYSTGTVNGSGHCIGGLVGASGDGAARIAKSYSSCAVSGEGGVGGLVGCNTRDIENCYSGGSVSGDTYVGGLVGWNSHYGTITQSYWDAETSSEPNMCGFQYDPNSTDCDNSFGKTTAEMMQQVTFEGWDFINVWDIGEGQTYPFLRTYSAADLNKDGMVNFLDLCIMAGQWMEMR